MTEAHTTTAAWDDLADLTKIRALIDASHRGLALFADAATAPDGGAASSVGREWFHALREDYPGSGTQVAVYVAAVAQCAAVIAAVSDVIGMAVAFREDDMAADDRPVASIATKLIEAAAARDQAAASAVIERALARDLESKLVATVVAIAFHLGTNVDPAVVAAVKMAAEQCRAMVAEQAGR